MDGSRGELPETPDAGMSRSDWQRGVNILHLVVKDYRQSLEAAFARRVIDQLAERAHGRR